MSQVVVKPQANSLNLDTAETSHWTPNQLQLIKDTVARGASNDELKLFLYRCRKMGLDPLKPGQIFFIKYGSSPGTIVVGIEGFRAKAAATGALSGIERGALRNPDGVCTGAWAKAYRKDWQIPATVEVSLAEYSTGKGNWAEMPETMIQKVAEAAALRMAFPDQLGGIYSEGETDKQPPASRGIHPEQPPEGDGIPDTSYRVPVGKWPTRTLEEIHDKFGLEEMRKYVAMVEDRAVKQNKPLPPVWQEMVDMMSAYVASWENAPREPGQEG